MRALILLIVLSAVMFIMAAQGTSNVKAQPVCAGIKQSNVHFLSKSTVSPNSSVTMATCKP